MPHEISAPLHFRTLLNGHTYLVADFFATWCPPCKAIAPVYEQLSNTHSAPGKVAFVKINIDEQPELAAQFHIASVPTFIVFKDGKQIEVIKGANTPALKRAAEKIAAEVKTSAEKPAPKPEVKPDTKVETNEVKDEKTVSGSYGMTGGDNWKMSLH
ncbi:thioredoxin-domain-containing protein [Bimuria novae-zelandiae CBS 107.79]|uniref:Thioredoxin-domain-containing protein n=1 Tax=Bimuria novae-zelandiae CBS 107.79 TaxID=1447943 RepID=A0A6A5UZA4_9PLEO|nr:thioredoxin-domain-containing protein [Bimuria novae-zelandiae CBS 107.79]